MLGSGELTGATMRQKLTKILGHVFDEASAKMPDPVASDLDVSSRKKKCLYMDWRVAGDGAEWNDPAC